MYERQLGTWRTPKGQPAHFEYRADSSDWNTVQSCTTEDEYTLADLELSGWALDIGAHIGGASIALLLDNPDLHVIAIEPIPANAELIRANAELNKVSDRLIVLEGAADAPGVKTVQITWNWTESAGTFNLPAHRFIGNIGYAQSDHSIPHDELICTAYSLEELLALAGAERFSFVKVDCEGCEARFFLDGSVHKLDRIHGEWHPPHATVESMHSMLDKSHELDIWGPGEAKEIGYGRGFIAIRR